MVAIVSGNSLGLDLTSFSTLGQRGAFGTATSGANGEKAFVNIANGNLVLQDADHFLASQGADFDVLRTYNSQGLMTDDDGDNWSSGIYAGQVRFSGTLGTAGSTVVRTARDGSQSTYAFDASRNLYVSTLGAGAYDSIQYQSAAQKLVWIDGDTGSQEEYQSTGNGNLLATADASGNRITYTYDASGKLTKTVNQSGESVLYTYASGDLSRIQTLAANGSTSTRVRYSYDALHRLTGVSVDLSPDDDSVADGKVYQTAYTHDGSSTRIASITQSDGSSLAFTYVQVGGAFRIATVKDGLNRVTRYDYDLANRRTTVTDPMGLATIYTYDSNGQLLQLTPPAINGVSASIFYTYSSTGDLLQVIDGENNAVTMQYDANGNQILQRDGAGNTVTRRYDSQNQLVTETTCLVPDPDGSGTALPSVPVTTRHVYDASGKNQLRFLISAEGRVTQFSYDAYGNRTASVQYTGAAYDLSNLANSQVPSESTMSAWASARDQSATIRTSMAYDARGQLQTQTAWANVDSSGNGVNDGKQSVIQYVHDRAGLLLQTVSATAGSTVYTYDGLGRVLSSTDSLGNVTLTHYNDSSHTVTVTLASGLTTTNVHDASGRVVSVVQSNVSAEILATTGYSYDADGRMTMITDATGIKAGMMYDADGRKVADIDGSGRLTEYVYNKNDQLIKSIRYSLAVPRQILLDLHGNPNSATIDAIRPLAQATDEKTWHAYDTAGRLVKTLDGLGALTETSYDGASRVVQTTQFATLLNPASFDSRPLLASTTATISATADRITRHFYDADHLLRGTLDAEGFLTEVMYDSAGLKVATTSYSTPTDVSLRATGTLDQLRPFATASDISTNLILNAKGQVAGAIDGERYLTEYVYDANGNVSQTVRYASKVSVALTATSTLASVRPASTAQDQSVTSTWDTLNRLTQQTDAQGTVKHYFYDNAGNLVKTINAVGTSDVRTIMARFDLLGRLTGELTGVGSAMITGSQTQAQVDAIWTQYGITHVHDAAGRRMSTTDQYGYQTLFFYDENNHLVLTFSPIGEVTRYTYNALNQLTTVVRQKKLANMSALTGTQAGGMINSNALSAAYNAANDLNDAKTTYTYDTRDAVTSTTDALGFTTTTSYNAFGETAELVRNAVSTIHNVDRRGLLTATTQDATGSAPLVQSFQRDAFGRITQVTDARGGITKSSYDRLGRVITLTDALNASASTTYDAFSRTLTSTDALGKTSTYRYSLSARSTSMTTPEGVTVTTVVNRNGQTQSITDGNGNLTTYRYDQDGMLISTTTPLTVQSNDYDRANRLIQTTDANGVITTFTYSAVNKLLTSTVDAAGLQLTTTYGYDSWGRQSQVTDAQGVVTTYSYDKQGQLLTQTVDAGGLNLITRFTHDANGNTLEMTAPSGTVTRYVYDALGRRTAQHVDPTGLNLTTAYGYDGNNNLVRKTDPLGNTTRFAYDADNRLVLTVDPLGNVQQNVYDAKGQIIKTIAYSVPIVSTSLGTSYSAAQIQSLVVSMPSSDMVEHRIYDQDGRLVATLGGTGSVVRWTHDANGNVLSQIQYATPFDLANWTVGSIPTVTADAAHDRRTQTVYDQLNRALYVLDGIGAVTAYAYDGSGNIIRKTAYANVIASATEASVPAIAAAVAVVADASRDSVSVYQYDNANRLTWSRNGIGAVSQYFYDKNGNRIKQIDYANLIAATALPNTVTASDSTDQTSLTLFDKANRRIVDVDAVGAVIQYAYDKHGNLVQKTSFAVQIAAPSNSTFYSVAQVIAGVGWSNQNRIERYAFDAADRQVIAIDAGNYVVETQYDGNSNVIRRIRYAAAAAASSLTPSSTLAQFRTTISANATLDRVERYAHDADGRLVYSVDGMGYVSGNQYDGLGNLVRTTRYKAMIPAST
ncbi:MAG: hypothetical protein ACRYGK_00765, partial [Janthinobacterium lividum]